VGILFAWENWESIAEPQSFVSQLISDDEGLADYLAGFLTTSQSWRSEDRVIQNQWEINLEFVQKFLQIDLGNLLIRTKKVIEESPQWLNGRRRIALETFIREQRKRRDSEP
ncbi:MAG: hypothetical protein ACTHMR_17295, partial [Thermomicrobiales bacterium]